MKRISITLLLTVIMGGMLFAQNKPDVKFDKSVYDYGSIKEDVGAALSKFEFTNTGTSPVIINRVVASCGCTSPTYTREPVLPGKTGEVKVAYSTVNRPGNFRKSIRIYTNVPDTVYSLTIIGNVIPTKR